MGWCFRRDRDVVSTGVGYIFVWFVAGAMGGGYDDHALDSVSVSSDDYLSRLYVLKRAGLCSIPPFEDWYGLGDKIHHINSSINKQRCRLTPFVTDTLSSLESGLSMPGGLLILKPLCVSAEDCESVEQEAGALFAEVSSGSNPAAGIGQRLIHPDGRVKPNIYFKDAVASLRDAGFLRLAAFAVNHADTFIADVGAHETALDTCSLRFIRYPVGVGVSPHVDKVSDSGDVPGPLLTVGLKSGCKFMDLYRLKSQHGGANTVHTSSGNRAKAVRVCINAWERVVLSGECRMAYAHSLPRGCDHEQITMLLKFGLMPGARRMESVRDDLTGIDVPVVRNPVGSSECSLYRAVCW